MRHPPETVLSGLAAALRGDAGRPFVTWYDDATGERVELSLATFDNWVCKLANLFSTEWDLEAGDLLGIAMPAHWHSMATLVAAWTSGLTVTLDPAVSATATITRWQDFAADVPAQPDVLLRPQPVTGANEALVEPSGTSTHAALVARGVAAAADVGLAPGGRLLTDLSPADPLGIDLALLAPLATGSSVVLLLNATADRHERVASQERVTCARWSSS